MRADEAYISSIPLDARAIAIGKYSNGRPKRIEYYVGAEMVGLRLLSHDGHPELEYSYRAGKKHGWEYRWDRPPKLLSAKPYENGEEHGRAFQWADDGSLVGSYTMEHGTGTDLWWQERDGAVSLSEAIQMRDGLRHGQEWHLGGGDPSRLCSEKQYFNGEQHGVERQWNRNGRLVRGYPIYWIHDQRVMKKQYISAASMDETLHLFRSVDNLPHRDFPPLILESLVVRPTG